MNSTNTDTGNLMTINSHSQKRTFARGSLNCTNFDKTMYFLVSEKLHTNSAKTLSFTK